MGFLKGLGKVRFADALFFLKDFGFHYAVTLPFFFFSPLLCSPFQQIRSGCARSAAALRSASSWGKNVFLAALALPQQIFPQSVFWAHPGYGAFCKCRVSKARRTGWLCWAIRGETAGGEREL